eukprot:1366471-Rhodomonas_salina.4
MWEVEVEVGCGMCGTEGVGGAWRLANTKLTNPSSRIIRTVHDAHTSLAFIQQVLADPKP